MLGFYNKTNNNNFNSLSKAIKNKVVAKNYIIDTQNLHHARNEKIIYAKLKIESVYDFINKIINEMILPKIRD